MAVVGVPAAGGVLVAGVAPGPEETVLGVAVVAGELWPETFVVGGAPEVVGAVEALLAELLTPVEPPGVVEGGE